VYNVSLPIDGGTQWLLVPKTSKGSQRVRDEAGVELTDDETARQHADIHRELLLAAFSVERHCEGYGIEVCGPNGEMLFRISLR
jgi:hypothetical protein